MRSLRGARHLAGSLQRLTAGEAAAEGSYAAFRSLCAETAWKGALIHAPTVAGQAVSTSGQHTVAKQVVEAAQHWGWAASQTRMLRTAAVCLDNVNVTVPAMGESVSEGTISIILKKPGDTVKEDDVIAQIETDKVTIDVKYTGKEPGKIASLAINEQEVVQMGKLVAVVETGGDAGAAQPAAPAAAEPPPAPAPAKPAAPKPAAPRTAPSPPPPPPSTPSSTKAAEVPSSLPTQRAERRVKMTRLRQRVAERLKGAQNTYAMLSTFNEVDMSSLIDMRNAYKDLFLEKHGVKLGFMSAFIKAAAYALNEVPAVNAVIDGDEIVYRDYIDISIAVATPKGLVVPVVRSADRLSFADCEKTLNELGKKARDGTISIDDMAGGTFTISNGGVYGSMLSTPIINPPQSAILGMHAIQQRAVVVGGKIEARPIMNIALTYDHRLIDGREAVTFLKRIKEVVEDPRRMLIDC